MKPQRHGPFPYTPIHRRPKQTLPGGARVALWVIPNIEVFPLNEHVPGGMKHVPDIRTWSVRDYGARVGIYRLMKVLTRYGIRGTVALNSEVCDDYPPIIEEAVRLKWEFMGHNQSNSRLLNEIPPDKEKVVIRDVLKRIETATGRRPVGWLGSGLQETWNTLDYLIAEGVRYVCDWTNDDQPYLMNVGGKQIVSIPYSSEINDLPQILRLNRSAAEFGDMIRAQFDVLYEEGAESARVMAICLHPFIIGVPHRIGALDRALEYICRHEDVWHATGEEIVDHYLKSGATF